VDGEEIIGETSNTYTLSNTEDIGIHEVMACVTDNGADLSTRVRLTIKDAPWLIKVPASHSTLQAALDWISIDAAANGGRAYTIRLAQDEDSLAPNTLSYNGNTVSITLVGVTSERTVTLSGTGLLFTAQDKVTLTLGDKITLQGVSSNTAALVRMNSGGTLEMKDGSKITGNNTSYGGGVYVDGGSAAFTMSDGEISGNNASNFGGGVYVSGSAFSMNGGAISYNIGGNSASGGGVYVSGSGASSTMSGGEIISNTASRSGGGVYVSGSGATSTMTNAEISGTQTCSAGGANGGGVHVDYATFTMNGGAISGNEALFEGSASGGGGMFIKSGTFTVNDGAISGNEALFEGGSSYGGGVYVGSGAFTKSGGTIYGDTNTDPDNGNTTDDTAANGNGHAVYVSSGSRKRNTTADAGVNSGAADFRE
jgi:hypothetical protein